MSNVLMHGSHRHGRAIARYPKTGSSTLSTFFGTARMWMARIRQRRQLVELDDRTLRDIGVSRDEALREAAKPFWR